MRTALCLGGADSLFLDLQKLTLPYDFVVACNDAGAVWPGELQAWVTLHPEKMRGWRLKREEAGYAPAVQHIGHRADASVDHVREYRLKGVSRSGSSGMFAVKYALEDLGADRAVLCGIPLTPTPHFFDRIRWGSSKSFQDAWWEVPDETLQRIRSMSGWTRVLCGGPGDWLHDLAKPNQPRVAVARRREVETWIKQRLPSIAAVQF